MSSFSKYDFDHLLGVFSNGVLSYFICCVDSFCYKLVRGTRFIPFFHVAYKALELKKRMDII